MRTSFTVPCLSSAISSKGQTKYDTRAEHLPTTCEAQLRKGKRREGAEGQRNGGMEGRNKGGRSESFGDNQDESPGDCPKWLSSAPHMEAQGSTTHKSRDAPLTGSWAELRLHEGLPAGVVFTWIHLHPQCACSARSSGR